MGGLLQTFRAWSDFLAPYPWARALQVVILFLLLASLVDRLISGLVRRLAARTETTLDDEILERLHRPLFATVSLLGLLIATYELDLSPELLLFTTAAVKTVLILVWLAFGLGASKLILRAMKRQEDRFELVQRTTEPLLRNAIAVLFVIAGVYGILVAWDINVTGLVASAGIVGLALSFAAQDTLANLFAGIAILTDQPYRIGDYIILDSGERGQVTLIGLRSTRLLTLDDVEVSIPNAVMGSAKIVNEATGVPNQYRIKVQVGVAYGADIDQVMDVLLKVGGSHPKVLPSPEPRVRFRQFGESSLDFELLCWIRVPAERGLVVHELNCEVYRKFADAGITIPFPQRDLYIKEMPERS
jgi:MscS family membrane protein